MTEEIGTRIAQVFIAWIVISFVVGGSVATGGRMLCSHVTLDVGWEGE